MTRLIYLIALLLLTLDVSAADQKYKINSCEYNDLRRGISLSGSCYMQATSKDGNFAYILSWPNEHNVVVEYINSQSGFHIWKINGQPASGIEVSREHLKGFSHDLNQILEWQ
jgi:hypothetical protein